MAGDLTIHAAAETGSVDCLCLLLDAGAGLIKDEKDRYGWSPAALAAKGGKPDHLRVQIDAGADMSTCFTANESWEGMSALEHAEEGMRENEGAVEFDGYHKVVMMLRELQNPSGSAEKTKPS